MFLTCAAEKRFRVQRFIGSRLKDVIIKEVPGSEVHRFQVEGCYH